MLNADDIKIKFIAWILQNDQDAIIGHEVLYSQNQRRADLVVIKQDLMYALEIKSDIDTINRLNDQIKDYLSTFDFVSVITTSKHIKEIRSKLNKKVGIFINLSVKSQSGDTNSSNQNVSFGVYFILPVK